MSELEKYLLAAAAVIAFLGVVAFLSQLIPNLIRGALPL